MPISKHSIVGTYLVTSTKQCSSAAHIVLILYTLISSNAFVFDAWQF